MHVSAVVACLFAVSAGNAFAGQSTVSAGYAEGDFQGVVLIKPMVLT